CVSFIGLILSLTILLVACSNGQDKAQGKWEFDDEELPMIMKIDEDDVSLSAYGLTLDGSIKDTKKDEILIKFDDNVPEIGGQEVWGKVDDDVLDFDGEKFKKQD
ncbi:hypothetical protein, partial [Staphylococcus auricularis]|uniref:hypothetical protein n=1 Tax=Staphylococcus auricularis TaxID=29379 RepID=UPI000D44AEAF